MSDIVERAEAAQHRSLDPNTKLLLAQLVNELQIERKKLERLQKYVTKHSDLCICDKAGLGHYDFVSCKVHVNV